MWFNTGGGEYVNIRLHVADRVFFARQDRSRTWWRVTVTDGSKDVTYIVNNAGVTAIKEELDRLGKSDH